MQTTLKTKIDKPIVKDRTEIEIEELEDKIREELTKLNPNEDIDLLTAKFMYKILLFYVEAYRLKEEIVRKKAVEYFHVNSKEYINEIP